MALSHILVPLILILIPTFLESVFAISTPLKTDTLKPGQHLRDWEHLISAGDIFTLGFFTPRGSSSTFEFESAGPRYVGIWSQRASSDPVWVGNPTKSVPDSSGSLSIDSSGVLKIRQANGFPILVNQRPAGQLSLPGNVSATLLDSGNFVVRETGPGGISGRVLWQSFDHPTNVLLPGMKIGFNLKTKKEISITSWISNQVPVSGAFRLGLDPSGANQLLVWRHNEIYWSSGILTNNGSSQLTLELSRRYIDYEFKFNSDKYMKYFSYSTKKTNSSVLSSWSLGTLGAISVTNVIRSNTSSITWISEGSGPCNKDLKNISGICITEKSTACRKGTEYFEPRRVYIMGNGYRDDSLSLGLSDCHGRCWRNCSCIAFNTFSRGGCRYWGKGSEFVPYDNFNVELEMITYVLDSAK